METDNNFENIISRNTDEKVNNSLRERLNTASEGVRIKKLN